jgi:hypothetical protein
VEEPLTTRVRWLRRALRHLPETCPTPPPTDADDEDYWQTVADRWSDQMAARQAAICAHLGLTPTEAYEALGELEQAEGKYLPEDRAGRFTRATMDLWTWNIWLPQWDEQLEANAEYIRNHPDDPRSKVLLTLPEEWRP